MSIQELKEKSIIVCGIVRDAANGLKRNIPKIQELCAYFGSYKVVIYENDSKDNTKKVLNEWHLMSPEHVHILSDDFGNEPSVPSRTEVVGNPFFSKRRIEKMAALRNRYLEYIRDRGWDADYLMVVDMDVQDIEIKGVLSSFEERNDWDAVTAFGYSTSPRLRRRYHDTYALTEYDMEDVPQTEMMIKDLAEKYARHIDKEWVRVFSAFGGLAIYRFERVKGLQYMVIKNNDPRVEVHCEHYSLYWQMAQKGETRVFINPRMRLEYQRLSWGIIWRSFKRMIGI